jgi:DNA-binding NtrC family response regulator
VKLLAIIELGGYPNLLPLYQRLGFEVEVVNSQRKARSLLKKRLPDVIVAEYIFQSDFRDRTSNLETLMAVLQRHPQVKVVVFYLPEQLEKLGMLEARFPLYAKIAFPITADKVEAVLRSLPGSAPRGPTP